MLHQADFLKEWYSRIQKIYAFGQEEKEGGFDIHVFSRTLLEEPSSMSEDYWKKLGITHIVSPSGNVTSLKKVASNKTYSIYSLR